MLEEVLMYLNNWFVTENIGGAFVIEGGSLDLPSLKEGQYYRIIGSTLNDGLHKCGEDGLTDETFEGNVWLLAVPKLLISITADIQSWQDKYGESIASPYASESFSGEYSYSKSSGASESGASWRTAFASRLAPYRKLRETSVIEPKGHQDPPFYRPFRPGHPWR